MLKLIFDRRMSSCFCCLLVLSVFMLSATTWAETILITGEIEDGNAQTVQMPRLPGS